MTIDFARIRPHRGSQHDGFEELCCQLAGREPPGGAARFVRNAPPDAGVECYWVLQNGDEHGWQAKYFDALDDVQWRQLDESVGTALEKHPRLVRYVVCLPLDLPDARVEGRRSLRQKWDDRVLAWVARAGQRGMTVSFELWGEHELTTRLVEPAYAGRRLYWFGGEVFSPAWFESRFREAVRYAGERYTASLHVELPLSQAFEGLGYTSALREGLRVRLTRVSEPWRELALRLESPAVSTALGGSLAALRDRCSAALRVFDRYREVDDCPPVAETLRSVQEASMAARECGEALHRASLPTVGGNQPPGGRFGYEAARLRTLAGELEELAAYCYEPDLQLIDRPALLLVGPGGYGKTHALCDLADRRVAVGQPTVLLLGQQLGGTDPWQAVLGRLALGCTRDEFLGALEAAAEAAGGRALLLLDAINEAPDINWRDELPAMLEVLRRFPRLGLAVSCRDVAEEDLIRPDLIRQDVVGPGMVRVEHTGLLGRIDAAIERFGRAYGVSEMHVPVLSAEFQSPLFLKLFLKTRQGRRASPTPAFNGLADLFDTIVRDLDERLSRRDQLNYHRSERRVQRTVERLAAMMTDARRKAVSSGRVLEELRQIHPASDYSDSLLARLIGEGILAEDVVRQGGRDERVVRFSYDRFGEHCVARVLLARIRGEQTADAAESPTLRWFLQDESMLARHGRRGLVVAACGLAPSELGQELFEAAPWVRGWPGFARLYLASLAFRPPASVGAAGVAYVEELLAPGSTVSVANIYEAAFEVAVIPGHALNARWLHRHLRSLPMPERDAVWSTFLHREWERGGPVRRLLDWAWPADCETRDPAVGVDPETIRLAALCLGWCLTTPNRFLRDRATKALVSLLHRQIPEVVTLLQEFGQVDDPYVIERVYAVAYGCAMRSIDDEGMATLGRAIYEAAFRGQPPIDVLTRDYARGCVERAMSLGAVQEAEIDFGRIRPPYDSPLLTHPPTWDELRQAYPETEFSGLFLALESQMSDFTHYVLSRPGIGGDDGWTDDPDPPPPPEPRVYTYEELEAVRELLGTVGDQIHVVESGEQVDDEDTVSLDDLLQQNPPMPEWDTDDAQTQEQQAPPPAPPADRLCPDYAARWIFRRVLELGWTPQRFRAFDREVGRHDAGRSPDKPERMGKKYQWIALREFMARLLDRRPYRHDYGEIERYSGSWQISLRDIDPSLLARGPVGGGPHARPSAWWMPLLDPLAPGADLPDRDWLRLLTPLPDFRLLSAVREPGTIHEWTCLSLSARWEEEVEAMEGRQGTRVRRVSFSLGSWLVPRERAAALVSKLTDWEFSGHDIDGPDLYGPFLGEYYWAPSFEDLRRDAEWTFDRPLQRLNTQTLTPGRQDLPVVPAAQRYLAEGRGYDCSLTQSVAGELPSVWLAERLGVRWARRHFRCAAEDGPDVTFDPSVEFGGPPGLLIRRQRLTRFLQESDLTLIVAVIGEKNAYSRHDVGLNDRDWPGRVVFRRLLRDDGAGAALVAARSIYLNRVPPHEEEIEQFVVR